MRKPIFTGSGVALVTPFTEGGLNLTAYRDLIEWQIRNDTDALIACGTTGEPSTMSEKEQEEAIACAVQTAAGRVPVIAGVGGNDTARVIGAAKRAKELGVAAVLAVTPYYNKTTQNGLVAHFSAVMDGAGLPLIVYNVPSRTGLNTLPATLAKLFCHELLAGVKEAAGSINQVAEIARLCPDLPLYSGNDEQVVPILSLGGVGVISAAANIIPKEMHDICARWAHGDTRDALALQLRINPLVDALFSEVNPIPVKTALNLMGKNAGPLRLPLVPMEPANEARLKAEMEKLFLMM